MKPNFHYKIISRVWTLKSRVPINSHWHSHHVSLVHREHPRAHVRSESSLSSSRSHRPSHIEYTQDMHTLFWGEGGGGGSPFFTVGRLMLVGSRRLRGQSFQRVFWKLEDEPLWSVFDLEEDRESKRTKHLSRFWFVCFIESYSPAGKQDILCDMLVQTLIELESLGLW